MQEPNEAVFKKFEKRKKEEFLRDHARIIAHLRSGKAATAVRIADVLDMEVRHVRVSLRKLRKEKLIGLHRRRYWMWFIMRCHFCKHKVRYDVKRKEVRHCSQKGMLTQCCLKGGCACEKPMPEHQVLDSGAGPNG